jgi:D-alanine-D-alanine ligase
MSKINQHIEIVRSTTKGLSSMSKVSCDSIFATLSKHFARVGITVINNLSDLEGLLSVSPDLVFLGMEFIPSDPGLGLADPNKIWLSDFLDGHNIAYTGSSQLAHELERNKPLAKQSVLDAGLRTSAFCVIEQNQPLGSNDIYLNYPLFIKPTSRGGGQGIDSDSVVHSFEQLRVKVQAITTKLRSDVLIEEYLPGREFSVAILKDEYSAGFLAMPLELVAPPDKNGARLLSGQIKSSNAEEVLVVTDEVVKSKVTALALDVFRALGARDYGRIDIRLDAAGSPHFLEANLIPSLISGYGSFPKACVLNIGMEYEAMIMRIAKLGLARKINDIEVDLEPLKMITPVFTAEVAFEPA